MPRPLPPSLHRERTRHGQVVYYVRRKHGPRIRIRAEFGTPAFYEKYRAALAAEPTSGAGKGPQAGSIEWAIKRYMASSAWAGLSPATRRARENIFHQITEAAGDGGLVKVNPALGVKLLKGANDAEGFHTWTEEEVARFEEAWPLGTRERLALDILLYTGLRRGDAARLGRQHVREGVITIRTEKTAEVVSLPVLEPLARSIAATTTGDLTFLITERGTPFAKESFGNWFKKACVKAKVPGSAHGLRKAGATRAAENGASERELMALFGWNTGKMAVHYTKAASQKRLAQEAAQLLLPKRTRNKAACTPRPGAGASAKNH